MLSKLAAMIVAMSIALCWWAASPVQAQQTKPDPSAANLPAGVFPNERIVVGGLARLFRLVVPSAVNGGKAVPLVFAFHGLGDTKDRFAQYSRLDELAQKQGFVLAYPNARALFWPLTGEWARDDLAFFDALYAQLTLGYNIDPNRVFLIGNSNGAYFSHLLAMQRADRIAAIAVHSGGLGVVVPGSGQAAHRYAVFAVHGAVDPVVPVSESRRVRDAYQSAGHVVEYLEIAGHDHRWAGHMDVNTRMWTFLSAHPRP